jgi:hypothetical protein
MRRPALFLAALAALASPALAQPDDLTSQYLAASQMFAGGAAGPMEYFTSARKALLEGLGGTWFNIGALGPADDYYTSTCEKLPVAITVRDGYSLDVSQRYSNASTGEGTLVTRYSSRGGNVFGSQADPAEMLKRLGFSEQSPAPDTTLISILNGNNGIATLVRPSPDILVIQTNYGPPQFFARCGEVPPVLPQ